MASTSSNFASSAWWVASSTIPLLRLSKPAGASESRWPREASARQRAPIASNTFMVPPFFGLVRWDFACPRHFRGLAYPKDPSVRCPTLLIPVRSEASNAGLEVCSYSVIAELRFGQLENQRNASAAHKAPRKRDRLCPVD